MRADRAKERRGSAPKRWRLICLCVAVALALGGCAGQLTERPAPEAVLPDIQIAYASPVKDSIEDRTMPAVLHYLNQNGSNLRTGVLDVQVRSSESEAQALLRTLLAEKVPDGLQPAAPGVALDKDTDRPVVVASGVATVSLTSAARVLSPKAFFAARMAITNTLTELPDITAVNVLIEGREPGTVLNATYPSGTMYRQATGDVDTLWRQLEVQQEQVTRQGLAKAMTIYAPAPGGALMVPRVRNMTFASVDPAALIADTLAEMGAGGLQVPEAPGIPALLDYLMGQPELLADTDGSGQLIRLTFLPTLEQALRQTGLSKGLLCAMLTQTLTRFVPNVRGLQVRLGTELIEILAVEEMPDAQSMEFDGGIMLPSHFDKYVGAACRIPLPTADAQRLIWVTRVLPLAKAASPRARLDALFKGPTAREAQQGLTGAAPENTSETDLQAIQLIDDVALVRLSARMAKRCEEMSADQVRNLVYAIVDTLTEMRHVRRVAFFVEERQQPSIGGVLEMRGFFLRNPGLTQTLSDGEN